MTFGGLWHVSGSALKFYTITVEPEPIDADGVSAARQLVEATDLSSYPGFVILHRGEEALWLLLHWWLPGGVLAEQLWSSPLTGSVHFELRDRPLMACVWELVPIAFERDVYVHTIMQSGSLDDYLGRTLPDGLY